MASGLDDSLHKAWREYQFQEWTQAETLFKQVISTHGPSSPAGFDARCGLAMIKQFNTRKPDPAGAREDYSELLQTNPEGERYILLTSLYAECAWQTGQTDQADKAWQSLFDNHPASILTQEALLQRTLLHMRGSNDKETANAIAFLKKTMSSIPQSNKAGLIPVFHGLIGDHHLQTGNPKEARQSYMQALEGSSPESMSYSIYAGRLFQVARISEKDLDDKETAARFYRRLVNETPNDGRFFFSLEKSATYGSITADEVRALKRQGLTENVIDELFKKDPAP